MNKNHFVYIHVSPSGKVYVGQTVNIKKRWGCNGEHYKTKKKNGDYIQPNFARAIVKYGWRNFEHKIVLENITKSEADYAEKYLIKWYKLHNMSYNCTDGGEGTCGIHRTYTKEEKKKISERVSKNPPMKGKKHTPEAIAKIIKANRNRVYTPEQKAIISAKISKANTGRIISEESKKKMSDYRKEHPELWIGGWNKKEVHQYDLQGNYLASYPSASEASVVISKTDNNASKILECINGKVASAMGYVWKSKKTDSIDLSKYKIVKTARGARLIDMSKEGRLKRSVAHGKAVNQYSLNGEYIATYCSATEAGRQTGVYYNTIMHCCRHDSRSKTAGGYLWEYDTGDNRVNKEKQLKAKNTSSK